MKKIYLILAHKNPKQLEKQIRTLDDGRSFFYIHIDLKSDFDQFAYLQKNSQLFLIEERVDCIWGDFSMIVATLNLMQHALNNHSDGMCILMSGNDYPIKPLAHINSFLKENSDTIFIDVKEVSGIHPNYEKRIEYYRINKNSKRGSFKLFKGFGLKAILFFGMGYISPRQFYQIAFKKRKLNLQLKYFGGSQWWAMSIGNLSKVNDFVQKNKKEIFDYFSYSSVPDEFLFHSIIMHLKDLGEFSKVEESITHVDWSRKKCKLPVTFEANDLKELTNQPPNKLFARKFDIEIDRQILDEIDRHLADSSSGYYWQ